MRTRHPVLTWSRALVLGLSVLTLAAGCEGKATPVDAAALGLPAVTRPASATQGETRAFLAAARGELTITAANGEAIEAKPGTPLLADDHVRLADGVALVIFTTGNALRIDGGLDSAVRDLAGFTSPPSSRSLEDELAAALTPEQAQDLGLSERLGGWQLRQRAMERPADEAAPVAPAEEVKSEEEAEPEEPAGGDGALPSIQGATETQPLADAKKKDDDGGGGGYGGLPGNRALDVSPKEESRDAKPAAEPAPPKPTSPATKPASVEDDFDGDSLVETKSSSNEKGSTTPTSGKTVKEDFGGWGLSRAVKAGTQSAVTLPAATRKTIAACVRSSKKSPALVKLTIKGHKISKAAVVGESLKCVEELVGALVDGVADGDVEATFVKVK